MSVQAVQVSYFQTTDGKRFEYEVDAVEHQAVLDAEPDIELFLETLEIGEKTKVTVGRHLRDFVKFRAAAELNLDQSD